MKIQSTYKELHQVVEELNLVKIQAPLAYKEILQGRCTDFLNKNRRCIQMLKDGISEIFNANIEKDTKGYLSEGEGAKKEWLFKSAQHKLNFDVEIDKLMKQACPIIT